MSELDFRSLFWESVEAGKHFRVGERIKAPERLQAWSKWGIMNFLRVAFGFPILQSPHSVGTVTRYYAGRKDGLRQPPARDKVKVEWDDGSIGQYDVTEIAPLGLIEMLADEC